MTLVDFKTPGAELQVRAAGAATVLPVDAVQLSKGRYSMFADPWNRNSARSSRLQGVLYLRNVQDADALIAAIQQCKAAGGKVREGTTLWLLALLWPACMPA